MKTKKDIRHKNIIIQAKALRTNGKHAGSKPTRRLINNIKRANEALTDCSNGFELNNVHR